MKLLRKNRDRNGCGLIAVHNAAQMSGQPIPYERVLWAARSWCKYSRYGGMTNAQITSLVRTLNLNARHIRKGTSFEKIMCSFFEGHSVIISYQDKQDGYGHAVLVTPNFKITNPDNKYVEWKDLFRAICHHEVGIDAWIVGKP